MTGKPHTVEFSRPLKVDRVPQDGSDEVVTADREELAMLAERLGLVVLHALSAKLRASRWRGGGLKLDGTLKADLEQVSVVSLEPFRHTVEFPVLRYFVPPGAATGDEDDVDVIESGHVDLGEVVAETLALELDPYPRQTGEVFDDIPESARNEETKPSPFAGLARLKRP